MVILRGRVAFWDLIHGDHGAGFIGCPSKQIVAGNPIEIRRPNDKIQPAFPNAFFVMREQRLGNKKGSGGLLLADAPLFSQ